MNTVCKECGSNSLEEDVQTGQLVCFDCGSVNAQAEYDGGLAFSEGAAGNAQLVGQMLRAVTGSPQAVVKSRTGLRVFEGGKFSQVKAFRTAADLAQQLSLPNSVLAAAKSLIGPTLELNLRRGVLATYVAAIGLFAAARRAGYPLFLLDFAAALRVSLFKLARSLQIVAAHTGLCVPAFDARLVVNSFTATKRDLSADAKAVLTEQTLQTLTLFHRERLVLGRLRRGVLAAAFQLACEAEGSSDASTVAAELARVCTSTVKKRLRELQQSPSASLDWLQAVTTTLPPGLPPSARNRTFTYKKPKRTFLDSDMLVDSYLRDCPLSITQFTLSKTEMLEQRSRETAELFVLLDKIDSH